MLELTLQAINGQRYLEGAAHQPCLETVDDTVSLIECCMEHRVHRLLLYADNLPTRFFDLSSGEAGAILQKLQNYHIKLAVVLDPDTRPLSHYFRALMAEENGGDMFFVGTDPGMGLGWLIR